MKKVKNIKAISKIIILFFIVSFLIYACSESVSVKEDENYDYITVPEGFPPIPFTDDNPYNLDKIKLGRRLFYDSILSNDGTINSCSHCMKQEYAFSDNKRTSVGFDKEPQDRCVMVLANIAYRTKIFWDGRGSRVESPAYRSIFLPSVFGADTNVVNLRLQQHAIYPEMFRKAFGENIQPNSYLASLAISAFARTFVSGNSAYDKYVRGNKSALSESQKRGMELFFSEKTRCSVCHSGIFFTDESFHNTGVNTHYFDRGRFMVTRDMRDWAKFITPTLRNVAVTAPYMHDGEKLTLEDVVENYNLGGRPFITKDTLIRPLNLTFQEKEDLIQFLNSLTDYEFINNPKYKKPF